MPALDFKVREAALEVSVGHLLHFKQQSPKKTAERILALYCEVYTIKNPSEKKAALLSPLMELLNCADDDQITDWIKNQFSSSCR